MLSVVATRYAKALVDVVTAAGSSIDAARVLSELQAIDGVIASSENLRSALASPAVAPSRKRAVMGRLLAPMNVLSQVRNFLFVLIDHRRVEELPSVIEAFESLLDERLGLVRADVRSAHELAPGQKSSLEAQVARLAGKQARVRFTIDPALIAGVVARVGSTVYDGSVRGQLDRLRARLGR
jgi:F-type H+-transporting ATPase subunit delta